MIKIAAKKFTIQVFQCAFGWGLLFLLAHNAWGNQESIVEFEKKVASRKGYYASPLVGVAIGGQGSTYGVPHSSGGILLKTPFQPTTVRVGVLGKQESRPALLKLRLFLERESLLYLNKRMGMNMQIAGLSEGQIWHQEQLVLYRAGFLRAALLLAEALAGRQVVRRVGQGGLPEEVDILIELGDASFQ